MGHPNTDVHQAASATDGSIKLLNQSIHINDNMLWNFWWHTYFLMTLYKYITVKIINCTRSDC